MGCCLSKRREDSTKAKAKDNGEKYNKSAGSGSRDPPPTESPHEEEKVKEVLSETPKFISIQRPPAAAAARSIDVDNGGKAKAKAKAKPKQADDDDQYPEMRCEVESTTAASEQSTTTNYSTFADVWKARADEVQVGEEDEMALKKTRSVLTTPSPPKVSLAQNRNNKKKVNYNEEAASSAAAAAISITGRRREMSMRGSVVDVGCRSARSSPSPQRRATGGGNTAAGVMSAHGAAMKRSDLGERSERRSVTPSALASASAMKRSAAASAASSPAMDQRQCRLMSSSSAAAARTTTSNSSSSTSSSRVNNGRYSSPQRIPATTSRLVDFRELVVGPATARPRKQEGPDTAANGSGGKLLEAPRPLVDNHDHQQEDSLENPLVSLECFIFL